MGCYSQLIARWPHIILPIVLLVVIACGLLIFFVLPFPDFTDPIKGFEARGTQLKGQEQVLQRLRDPSTYGLGYSPSSVVLSEELLNDVSVIRQYTQFANRRLGIELRKDFSRIQSREKRSARADCAAENFSVDSPKIVFASRSGSSLLSISSLKSMCAIEKGLLPPEVTSCPRRQSVVYAMEVLSGKNCNELEELDMEQLLDLLQRCAGYYNSGQLTAVCDAATCPRVPVECWVNGTVYNVLHYLTDSLFFSQVEENGSKYNAKLTLALCAFPQINIGYKEFYRSFVSRIGAEGDVYVKAIDTRVKFELFDDYIIADIIYFGVAMLLILVIMCLYLRSISVTIATVLEVVFTLMLAYVIYHALGIHHFPFINLLSGLICIAIGADDVFIFFDTWLQVKAQEPEAGIEAWITRTFHHAAASIFVTSLTTASAFFANIVSEITDIKCFGIFAGISILCNFIFMITWVPSIIVLIEKTRRACCTETDCCSCCNKCILHVRKLRVIYNKVLPWLVSKFGALWVILLLLLGVGGIVAVFGAPRLELPTSKEFQVFQSTDPIEVWDREVKYRFRYFQQSSESSDTLPLSVVWGFGQEDTGDHFNPHDLGHFTFDPTFNLAAPESQVWMEAFCKALRNNSSIVSPAMSTVPCTLTVFNDMMSLPCVRPEVSPCCGNRGGPFEPDIFAQCFPRLTKLLTSIVQVYGTNVPPMLSLGQAIYNDKEGTIEAFRIDSVSTQRWSPILNEMETFYGSLKTFMREQLQTAPVGAERGWITSSLKFYDLQRALSSGTYVAIGVSVGVAFVIMLLTSLNLIITAFALFTIVLSIAVTVGVLVLLGWELNALESITISLAVGLSIDFSIHYGVAYRLSPSFDRAEKVRQAFSHVGSPVAMAALTTFIAGVAMMPAKVLAYTQLGVFLMIVMATSWLYATFFFQSLCCLLGPKQTTNLRLCRRCTPDNEEEQVHPADLWNPDQQRIPGQDQPPQPPSHTDLSMGEHTLNCDSSAAKKTGIVQCNPNYAISNHAVNAQANPAYISNESDGYV